MHFKKTLRWLDPHGYWGKHNEGYYFSDLLKSDSRMDTGFCNRVLHWEVAYDLRNRTNDPEFQIMVQKKIWPEFDLLEVPYTFSVEHVSSYHKWMSEYDYDVLYMKAVFDVDNQTISTATPIDEKYLLDLYKSKNFDFSKNPNLYSNFGFHTLDSLQKKLNFGKTDIFDKTSRPLQFIKPKHTLVNDHLNNKFKNYVGIHIRRGNGVKITEDSILSMAKEIQEPYREYIKKNVFVMDDGYLFYKDEVYFDLIEKMIKINPKQKIYISHDLPDEFIQPYYDKFGHHIIETKYNSRHYFETFYSMAGLDISFLKNYGNVIDNIIDLFSLSNCGFIITSPKSSWSEFASTYKNAPSYNIDWGSETIIPVYKDYTLSTKSAI
jgi:hypothetical protein